MTSLDLPRFLLGSEPAIRALAASPWTPWVGLLLVLSAALARASVHRDLRREPWVLLVSPAASVAASALVFGLVHLVAGAWPTLAGYAAFLGLFWLTAPLAWLYALPVERWSPSRAVAVKRRLWLLGLVAAWRVALTVRALSVLLEAPWWQLVPPVLLAGDLLALGALYLTWPAAPRVPDGVPPIMHGMGVVGPRARAADDVVTGASGAASCLGALTLPVWIAGAMLIDARGWARFPAAAGGAPGADTWAVAAAALGAGVALVVRGQRRQARAGRVDDLLRAGRADEALADLARLGRADLPPAWEPAPAGRFDAGGVGLLLDLLERLERAPAWARPRVLEQARDLLGEPMYYAHDDALLERVARVLPGLPEGPALAREAARGLTDLGAAQEDHAAIFGEDRRAWPAPSPAHAAAVAAITALAATRPEPAGPPA